MKKILFLLLTALIANSQWGAAGVSVNGQSQTIRLACAEGNECAELTFKVVGSGSVHVDWGKGSVGDYDNGILAGKCQGDTVVITMPTTVTGFDCEGFCISWLDVSGAPQLVALNCADNRLEELYVDGLPLLDELKCNDNQIGVLNTSGNARLRYLDCANNQLETLDLSDNPLLEVVNCSGNRINRLPLKANDALQGFWGADNGMTTLDLSLCRNISSVVVNYGPLESISFSYPTKLQDLWVNNNRLTTLNLRGTDALYSANVSNNALESLDIKGFSNRTKINYFDCSNNRLPFSSFFPDTKVVNYICGVQEPVDCGYDSLVINELTDFAPLITNSAGSKIGIIRVFDAASDAELQKGGNTADYQYLIGRVRFWHEMDSIYMVITASKYPDLEIRTNTFTVYDPEAVGIKSYEISQSPLDNETFFDLQGRRVLNPRKGSIYIVNGKKIAY